MNYVLQRFATAGLPQCPECGATGDYGLLKDAALAVIKAWNDADGYPDLASERLMLRAAIAQMCAAINMQKSTESPT